jgi:hypothetical protein
MRTHATKLSEKLSEQAFVTCQTVLACPRLKDLLKGQEFQSRDFSINSGKLGGKITRHLQQSLQDLNLFRDNPYYTFRLRTFRGWITDPVTPLPAPYENSDAQPATCRMFPQYRYCRFC